MNVLIACEESQRVCSKFRELGHNAFSCDVQQCSGGHPEWHILGDVLNILNPVLCYDSRIDWMETIEFRTMDEKYHVIEGKWDLIIAHPPCTHLASAGQHWFTRGLKDLALRDDAISFFMEFVNADCDRIAVENPVGIMSTEYRKPDQIIQPYWFGEPYTKRTCLWLKGLPPLKPTNILEEPEGGWLNKHTSRNGKYTGFINYDENGKILAWNDPRLATVRSRTYYGIADAMASQWGKNV